MATAHSTARKLPLRLSGTPRRIAGFVVLITHALRHTHQRMPRSANVLPPEAFVQYISRLDELLDRAQRPDVKDVRAYQSDPIARAHLSRFVKGVKEAPLTRQQRNELFRLAGNFRRDAWRSLHTFEDQPPTLANILRMKEITSGGDARVLTAMIHVGENIPKARRVKVEESFANLSMGCQIFDDLVDFYDDHRNHVPNIVDAALRLHPDEYQKALARRTLRPWWLKRHCPHAYAQIQSILKGYLAQMPNGTGTEKAIRAVPRIFWLISQLRASPKKGTS